MDGHSKIKKKPRCRALKSMAQLTLLMSLCYLQVLYPMAGMPLVLQVFLWTTYVGQIAILTTRLFGIKIATLAQVLNVIGKKLDNN